MTMEQWISVGKNINLNPYLKTYTKINYKRTTGLNIRPRTIELLE